MANWQQLGATAPTDLVDARLQLHHAAQIASAVGRNLAPKKDDDSHTNLGWLVDRGALASHRGEGVQAALSLEDPRLLLLAGDETLAEFALLGKTVDNGYDWLRTSLAAHLGRPIEGDLKSLHYEIPAHPVGAGQPFSSGPYEELGGWFSNADTALKQVLQANPQASDVRCWPHHFDLATLINLGDGKSVGVGLSPGDGSYAEPYWYVSPWPYPVESDLPALPHSGRWHTQGFTAAVLTGSQLVAAENQQEDCREFLDAAIGSSKRLVR